MSLKRRPEFFYAHYRVALHVLFWTGIFVYDVIIWGLVDAKYGEKFVSTMAELPVKMGAAYFTLYVLIDRFLFPRHYRQFAIYLVASMISVGLILRCVSYFILYPIYYPEGLQRPLLFLPKILIAIFYTYAWVGMVATIHLIRRYYERQQETNRLQQVAQQLETEKLEAELKLLKSQIHPHFLFNTLNNLYALTVSRSQKAPEMVHKLSALMSYMLFDSNQRLVSLSKEIEYLRNYIDLEQIRYGKRLEVRFANYVHMEGISIAPLLLLPFVENSFKHGVRDEYEHGWIHIDLSIVDEILIFKVENSKPDIKSRVATSGLGLSNVRKRLDHLYPDQYALQTFDTPETYLITLELSADGKPVNRKLKVKEV